MRSLVLDVENTVYEKFVNFLKILTKSKTRLVEEIKCSNLLKDELMERRKKLLTEYLLKV